MKKITMILAFGLITFIGNAQTFQWAKQIAGTGVFDVAINKTIGRLGGVVVIGSFSGSVDFDPGPGTNSITSNGRDGFIGYYDEGGNLLSIITTNLSGTDEYVDANNVSSSSVLNVIHKIGNSFKLLTFNFGSGVSQNDLTLDSESETLTCTGTLINIVLGNNSPLYVGGTFSGSITLGTTTLTSAGGSDIFLIKFGSPSNVIVKHGGTNNDELGDILLNNNKLFLTGNFLTSTSFFNTGGGTSGFTSAGARDMFLAAVNSSDLLVTAITDVAIIGSTSNERGESITLITNATIAVSGSFTGTVDFDPRNTAVSNQTSNTLSVDGFVASYTYGAVGPGSASAWQCNWSNKIGGAFNDFVNTVSYSAPNVYYGARLGSDLGSASFTGAYDGVTGTAVTYGGLLLPSNQTSFNFPTTIDSYPPQIYMGGVFNASTDFDPGSGTATLSAVSGGNNGYILKMGSCDTSANPGISSLSTICTGTQINLSAIGALKNNNEWKWYTGACGDTPIGSGRTITVSPTITTTYYLRGEGGCVPNSVCASRTVTVNTVIPIDEVSLSGTTLTAAQTGATVYRWYDCTTNAQISGEFNQSFTPTVSGNYYAIIVIGACSVTSACTQVTILSNNEFEKLGIKLYPNPIKNIFTIEGEIVIEKLAVYNLLGQKVKVFAVNESSYDISELASGTYIIEVLTDKGIARTKIIKE